MNITDFLNQVKVKCEAKAREMASLELSIHDDAANQKDLKEYFGFTDNKLAARKIELQKLANGK